MNAVILERHDRPPQAPAGGDLVPGLQLFQHPLPLLLPPLLRHDQKKIKNGENENERRDPSHPIPPPPVCTAKSIAYVEV